MKKLTYLTVLVAVIGLLLIGCGKSTNPMETPQSDQGEISSLAKTGLDVVGLDGPLDPNSEFLFGFSGGNNNTLTLGLAAGGPVTLSTGTSPISRGNKNQGWWSGASNFLNSSFNTNYFCGDVSNNGSMILNNFFTFDISGLQGQTVTSAQFNVRRFVGFSTTGQTFHTYSIFDVSTSASVLNNNTGFNAAIHTDLASGKNYGNFNITVSGNSFEILNLTLNANAILDLNSAISGGSQFFSIGGTLFSPNQPPNCSGASILDQSADANCQATISGADVTGVTDPDGDPLTITVSPTTLSLGANTVTVTADDGNGGTCSIDITVNVIDDTPPSITCPADITVNTALGASDAVVAFTVTATDNCPGVFVVCTPASGSTFPAGTTTVNCTATDGAGNQASCSFDVTVVQTVGLDIKPGSDPNCINLGSEGVVPVAILGSATFDVTTIDQTMLEFEGNAAKQKGKSGKIVSFDDVNNDGFTDLVVQFPTEDLGLTQSDTEATVTGILLDGTPIQGTDDICIVL